MRARWILLLGLAFASEAHAGRGSAKCRAEAVADLAQASKWHDAYQASIGASFGDGFFPATGMVRTPESEAFVVQWWLPRLQDTFDRIWAVLEPEAHAWWADRMTCKELQGAVEAIEVGTTPEEDAAIAARFTDLMSEYQGWVQSNLGRWIAPFEAEIQGIVVEAAPAFVDEARARGFLPTAAGG